MANWVRQYGHALMPLAQELEKLLLQCRVLHPDEIPIKQLTQKNLEKSLKPSTFGPIAPATLTREAHPIYCLTTNRADMAHTPNNF